jgi:hypothetical protein
MRNEIFPLPLAASYATAGDELASLRLARNHHKNILQPIQGPHLQEASFSNERLNSSRP